jgi:hypothetical protein
VIDRACQSIEARTPGSSIRPKSIRARNRLPFRQWTTAELCGDHPNPPFRACVCAKT